MDTLTVLKTLAVFFTAVFGILGIFIDPDAPPKRTARWITAAAIVLSAAFGVTIGVFESRGQNASNQLLREIQLVGRTTNQIDTQVQTVTRNIESNTREIDSMVVSMDRVLSPLGEVHIDYQIDVKSNYPYLVNYLADLGNNISGFIGNHPTPITTMPASIHEQGINGIPVSVAITPPSNFLPPKSDKELYTLLGYSQIQLHFYRRQLDPTETRILGGERKPDMSMAINTGFEASGLSGPHVLIYSLHDKQLSISAVDVKADRSMQSSNGAFKGISDLRNSELIIVLPEFMTAGSPNADAQLTKIRAEFDLHHLTIGIGSGHRFNLQRPQIKRVNNDVNGNAVYSYRFPSELSASTSPGRRHGERRLKPLVFTL